MLLQGYADFIDLAHNLAHEMNLVGTVGSDDCSEQVLQAIQ